MDPDTEDAALFQLELEQRRRREDQLLQRIREECSGFRMRNDEFTADFNLALTSLKQDHDNDQYQ